MKEYLKYALILIIILLIILVLISIYKKNNDLSSYDFHIYFFNAGKADAILLTKDDKYIMIDTGEEKLSTEILDYFKKNNIKKIEYLIITHFDKDHVGSASSIIENIEIGEVLQTNIGKDSKYYANYLNALNDKNIDPIIVKGDYNLNFSNLKITVNGAETVYEKDESNNSSLIVSINYDKNSFLFTGDAENDRLKDWLKNNTNNYDFLKIPYHGKYNKKLDDLLKSTNPKYSVITCSDTEGAEEETLNLIDKYEVKNYLTKDGSITVYSNGQTIKIIQ